MGACLPGWAWPGIHRQPGNDRPLHPLHALLQAPETYHQMSPFTHADKIKKPLLLIHGEADNNTGASSLPACLVEAAALAACVELLPDSWPAVGSAHSLGVHLRDTSFSQVSAPINTTSLPCALALDPPHHLTCRHLPHAV